MTRKQYIDYISNSAIRAVQGTGLFASVLIAQAILESGNGNSTLAKDYYNHFGIKAGSSWSGPSVLMRTREIIDGQSVYIDDYFRVYRNTLESLRDRNSLLLNASRYQDVSKKRTPEQQAKELQQAGYATANNYAELLIKIINDENLKRFDRAAIAYRFLPFWGLLGIGVVITYLEYKENPKWEGLKEKVKTTVRK